MPQTLTESGVLKLRDLSKCKAFTIKMPRDADRDRGICIFKMGNNVNLMAGATFERLMVSVALRGRGTELRDKSS